MQLSYLQSSLSVYANAVLIAISGSVMKVNLPVAVESESVKYQLHTVHYSYHVAHHIVRHSVYKSPNMVYNVQLSLTISFDVQNYICFDAVGVECFTFAFFDDLGFN